MTKIIGAELKNIPWEKRPAGCNDVVWRYSSNPVIQRLAIYYGCADTVTGLAFGYIDDIINYIKKNPVKC